MLLIFYLFLISSGLKAPYLFLSCKRLSYIFCMLLLIFCHFALYYTPSTKTICINGVFMHDRCLIFVKWWLHTRSVLLRKIMRKMHVFCIYALNSRPMCPIAFSQPKRKITAAIKFNFIDYEYKFVFYFRKIPSCGGAPTSWIEAAAVPSLSNVGRMLYRWTSFGIYIIFFELFAHCGLLFMYVAWTVVGLL